MAIPNSSAMAAVMTTALLLLAAGRVAEGQLTDCAVKLVPCADYLNKTNPSSVCCEALKTVVTTQLPCLCKLIRDPSTLAGINTTQALELPKHCGLPSYTSACDVFTPPSEGGNNISSEGGSTISGGVVAGIVIGVFAIILLLGVLWWKVCLRCKVSKHDDLKGLDLHTGTFTLRQIKAATNNFDPANKIGEGGFGPVFKGVLSEGTVIAVKQLASKSRQGNREFINELGMISALQHPHLVKLYGCCIERNQLLLVYEYMENNNLARALFGSEEQQLKLDWPTRYKICIGIAKGLAYLHEESRLKIVHRDIKATNVLLDKNLIPKISDFGLAKLHEEDNTHISTRVAGTYGYMSPEYAMRGYLTDKADVYSFGVVLLEVISGRSNTSMKTKDDCFYLLDWANTLKRRGNLIELVDSRLGSDFNREEAMTAINVGLLCTNAVAAERPSMSAVVNMLEWRACIQHYGEYASISVGKMRDEEAEGESISMDAPWASSSTASGDLYPVTLDTKN